MTHSSNRPHCLLIPLPPLQAGLTESEARFYVGCIVLGLESMHNRGILHRCEEVWLELITTARRSPVGRYSVLTYEGLQSCGNPPTVG